MSARELHLIAPGPLEQRTGGYLYAARIAEDLRALGWTVIAQGLEGAVISPRIVGESVGLHPVWILLALSLGGFYFGFVGLLIGVPLAVAVKLLLVRGVERYRRSGLYKDESALSR